MDLAIDKNMVDKDEYPLTAEIESRCVHMLAGIWNSPNSANTLGTSAVGSSEACMLGAMAMKWRWRARMAAQGKPAARPNLVCGPVQICWHKFCRYWDVEMREVPMERGRSDERRGGDQAHRQNTIGVVPTLGVTYDGRYELVEPLAAALDTLQAEKGLNVDIHVNGASARSWRGLRPRHRVGLPPGPGEVDLDIGPQVRPSPARAGWVIWRDAKDLPEDLIFRELSRRRHADIRDQFLAPGRADHRAILQLPAARPRRVSQGPHRELPDGQVPREGNRQTRPVRDAGDRRAERGHSGRHLEDQDGADPGYTLFDLADRLRVRGWQVPAYTLPDNVSDIAVQRILVRQGVTTDLGSLLLADFRWAIEHFDKHPVNVSMTEAEAGGFNHG